MDLINDLSSDLALAFLIEQRHRPKLDLREAKSLIHRVEAELQRTTKGGNTSGSECVPPRLSQEFYNL